MDKCDKCENMARVTVSGYIVARYLCARHAGDLCASVGDTAGADHFTALMEGDRERVSACNWCGDIMKEGVYEIHKCLEEREGK